MKTTVINFLVLVMMKKQIFMDFLMKKRLVVQMSTRMAMLNQHVKRRKKLMNTLMAGR